MVGNLREASFAYWGQKGGSRPNIFKLQIGAFIPRSVGRLVGWLVGQLVGRSSKNYKKIIRHYKNLTKHWNKEFLYSPLPPPSVTKTVKEVSEVKGRVPKIKLWWGNFMRRGIPYFSIKFLVFKTICMLRNVFCTHHFNNFHFYITLYKFLKII